MADKWWSPETVAVVTGANKGIGYHIAGQLGQQGMKVVLTARDPSLGKQAVEKLRNESGLNNIEFHQLDITKEDTIDDLAK